LSIKLSFRFKNAGWPQQRDATLQARWALDQTDDLSSLLGRLSMQAKP
jgi:hypothetical protein